MGSETAKTKNKPSWMTKEIEERENV
jgi:hypothetical protein